MEDKNRDDVPRGHGHFFGLPKKLTQLLKNESDRGAILILAAYLDELLGLLVRNACINDDAADTLLKWGKPAGDFGGRILLCEAFALIHEEDVRALRLVKNIRNSAAHFDHKARGFDVLFDSSTTTDQVRALSEIFKFPIRSKDPAAVRAAFVIGCRYLAMRLLLRLGPIARPVPLKSAKELAAEARANAATTPLGETFAAAESAARAGDPTALLQLVTTIAQFGLEEPHDPQKVSTVIALQYVMSELMVVASLHRPSSNANDDD